MSYDYKSILLNLQTAAVEQYRISRRDHIIHRMQRPTDRALIDAWWVEDQRLYKAYKEAEIVLDWIESTSPLSKKASRVVSI